jgi:hypothetical protein
MKEILITLSSGEEMNVEFLDLFSKVVINNSDYIFGDYFEDYTKIKY